MPTKCNGSGLFIGTFVAVDTVVAAINALNAKVRNQERAQGQLDCHLLYLANMDLRDLPSETKDKIAKILMPAVDKQVVAYEPYATPRDSRKAIHDRLMSFKLSLEDALGVRSAANDTDGPKAKPAVEHRPNA